MNLQSVAVFCGSQSGSNPIHAQHASELGKLLAMLGVRLVYGGSKMGLMGRLADAVLANGGTILGVVPQVLIEWEHQHTGLSELAIVPDIQTRKRVMYERADAAIVLPGGFGTLDECFEILTWNQLKLHDKKIYLLNSDGFYNHLIKHLRLMQKEGYLRDDLDEKMVFCETPIEIFNRLS